MFKKLTKTIFKKNKGIIRFLTRQLMYYTEFPFYYIKDVLHTIAALAREILADRFKKKLILKRYGQAKFLLDLNFSPEIKEMLINRYETHVRNVLIRYLTKGGVFVDIGANIGYISAIAAGIVGSKGQIHAFEPIPYYFKRLKHFKLLNPNLDIHAINMALGEKEASATMKLPTYSNIGCNVIIPEMLRDSKTKETVDVQVIRADDYLAKHSVKNISLIKIDVEGYEFPVLKGLEGYFSANIGYLPPLIVEVVPHAYAYLNSTIDDLINYLSQFSYTAFYHDGKKRMDLKKLNRVTDVLFLQG